MSETRPSVKLDFTSGLEKLPAKLRVDPAATTLASVAAGRELGFSARQEAPPPPPPPLKLDGRRLRSRGANTQLNLKVTEAEKQAILEEASRHIQDPLSPVSNIGEFVVMAIEHYKRTRSA